ncbi:MAG: hypothetical protein ACXWQR_10725 [Ktedonobacterales bacterium]
MPPPPPDPGAVYRNEPSDTVPHREEQGIEQQSPRQRRNLEVEPVAEGKFLDERRQYWQIDKQTMN